MKKISYKTFKTFILLVVLLGSSIIIQAQIDVSTPNGKPPREELPKPILETLAKKRIEDEKKEYQKLLDRGEEAVKLSEELEKSFAENNKLSSKDQKKLKELEKLLKKIRSDLGGDDDQEEIEEKPSTTKEALNFLKKNTLNLFNEIKQTSRHTISVVAIESSNILLKIVKFLRFGF